MSRSPAELKINCTSCGSPKAHLPRRISGYYIPQLCTPCLLKRADRMERERCRYYRNHPRRCLELETK